MLRRRREVDIGSIWERNCVVCKSETTNWRVCEGFRWKHDKKVRNEEIED